MKLPVAFTRGYIIKILGSFNYIPEENPNLFRNFTIKPVLDITQPVKLYVFTSHTVCGMKMPENKSKGLVV
jgi:hypothetical protein